MARSIVTIDDLTTDEINQLFELADQFLTDDAWKVVGRRELAQQHILSTLFYEPSTRTRFSFESAMLRLGGHILSSSDPASTSAAKGESIADTVRVVENYADMIVIRHPWEGAARVAAEFSSVPVVNAGDGSHEHPTQTLCDLYTLRREKKTLKGLDVLICGDLKNGRTVHSLVYALARFGANIIPQAAPGFDLPEHVCERLKRKYGCEPRKSKGPGVVYVTPDEPHQPTLFTHVGLDIKVEQRAKRDRRHPSQFDVFYVTRLQLERIEGEHAAEYPVINSKFLKGKRYQHSSVLHPLPRVDELGYDMDIDPRGVYFKQASYGVPVRMAIIAALLELKPCFESNSGGDLHNYEIYSHSLGPRCEGARCITNHEAERRHLRPKFWIVAETPVTLRCVYCERELKPECVGSGSARKYSESNTFRDFDPQDRVFFQHERDALKAEFRKYVRRPKSRNLGSTVPTSKHS